MRGEVVPRAGERAAEFVARGGALLPGCGAHPDESMASYAARYGRRAELAPTPTGVAGHPLPLFREDPILTDEDDRPSPTAQAAGETETMPTTSRLQNPNRPTRADPLSSVDQRVRDHLRAQIGAGRVTAPDVRAAHKAVLGTEAGAGACVVRFDRAGLLRTASGALGARGRQASERIRSDPAGEDQTTFQEQHGGAGLPRQSRPARSAPRGAGTTGIVEEAIRLRALHPDMPSGELAALAEDNVLAARRVAAKAERAPDRPPRVPADPLRRSDPRVAEMVRAWPEGHVSREDLRSIRSDVLGPRPEAAGEAQAKWDRDFDHCVARVKRAGLYAPRAGHAAPASGTRLPRGGASGRHAASTPTDKAGAAIMRASRPDLSCLRKHALGVARIDADACPLGFSKPEGAAIHARKVEALKGLDGLWAVALKSVSPTEAIGLLGQAADLVRAEFPGIKLGYEGRAAALLSAALEAGASATATE